MPSYSVMWAISIEAGSPEEAASKAQTKQLDFQSKATAFSVTDSDSGEGFTVDLQTPSSEFLKWHSEQPMAQYVIYEDSKWFFYDETYNACGPYNTQAQASEALNNYIKIHIN